MACGGPSKDFAVIRAEQAYADIMQLLKDKYHVERPTIHIGIGIEKKFQDDWDHDAEEFKARLVELFWTSDCNGF
jgi:hypothetical protein